MEILKMIQNFMWLNSACTFTPKKEGGVTRCVYTMYTRVTPKYLGVKLEKCKSGFLIAFIDNFHYHHNSTNERCYILTIKRGDDYILSIAFKPSHINGYPQRKTF